MTAYAIYVARNGARNKYLGLSPHGIGQRKPKPRMRLDRSAGSDTDMEESPHDLMVL